MTPSDLTGLPDNILRKMVEEARAEAARQALLVQRYEPAYLGLPHVVRERDEARAEAERLTNKLNADSQNFEIKCLSSEVERLKHLIFVWRQASYSGTPDEYQRAAVDLEDEALRISVVRAEPKHQEGSDD